ncbi:MULTISPECIES: class I SAM-dependent methyltransferase [Methanosarcina]|nr:MULTISPECIES: class I SAM-dependent methyltransferase [Methanosarcina]
MGLDHSVANAVDFGCGYGTVVIPALKLIKGTMYAIDIEEKMIKRVT